MRNTKVVFLITDLMVGGAEKALVRTAIGLSKSNYDVSVMYLYGKAPLAETLKNAGVPVTNLNMRIKWDVSVLLKLYKLFRKEKPQILHTYMFHADLLGRLIGRLAHVPIIISSRRNIEIGGQIRETINRLTVHLSDATTAVCDNVRQAEIKRSRAKPEKVFRIYNGVEIENFKQVESRKTEKLKKDLGIGPDDVVIGTVGRFLEKKGHPFLIRAMHKIISKFPGTKLLLVGYGRLQSRLERKVNNSGLSEKVIFTGSCSDISEMLSVFDVFILPSLWEGMPNAVLEAMAAGLPVVSTAVGGTPEVIKDGETGLLVPAGDSEALADGVINLLKDPERAKKMGATGRDRVEKIFTRSRMIADTEALYEKLVQEKL